MCQGARVQHGGRTVKFASRKFIVAIMLTGCATYLAGTGVMDGNNVMVVFGIVGGGYGFANVLDKKNGGAG